MRKLIRGLPEWGVRPNTTAEQANHFRVTNMLLLFMFFGSLIYTTVLFVSGAKDAALLNCTAPFVFGGGLFLMKQGYTKLARVLVVTISYLGGYAIVASVGPQSYFQFIFLFASAFSVVFFSSEEKVLLIYGLMLAFLCFITLEVTDYQPVLGMSRPEFTPGQLQGMRYLSVVLVWLLMVSHFVFSVQGRRRTQEQLVSSSKMVAMGRMAAGIAHEVNNPLQRIVGHAERLHSLAASGTVNAQQVSALSEQIEVVAMRIASIVKGLLALSRDASGDNFTEVSLHSVVALSLDYSRARLESQKIELRLSEIPKQWTLRAREAQLSEVMLNLLSNASDAVSESKEPWIRIEATAEPKFIEIAISDSGPGIDPKLRQRIFDPFFTTKPVGKGTGLGLSVSQGIMVAHGGDIFLDHKSAQTRFVIRVPRGSDLNAERFQNLR